MAYEPKEGSTTLFLNDKWSNVNQPIYKNGKMLVNGKAKEAAIWAPKDFKEEDFRWLPERLSLKISEPFEKKEPAPGLQKPQLSLAQELDDDIPF